MRTASVNGPPTTPAGGNREMVECRRICANHGVKAVCIIDRELLCVSFGNTIKIINVTTVDVLLQCAASTSSNIYGLTFQRRSKNGGILIAHGVHKIYCYILNISPDGKSCSLKLVTKYCTNKWILRAKFLLPIYESIGERYYEANVKGTSAPTDNRNVVLLCLSNGSIVLLHIYRGISSRKYKFRGIHLLYSADISINEKKKVYQIEVAGGTPFNKILLWNFKLSKNKKIVKFCLPKKITPLEHTQELSGHRGIIFKVKFFAKRKYVGSVSDDREGRIWRRMCVEVQKEPPIMNSQRGSELIERKSGHAHAHHHCRNHHRYRHRYRYHCVRVLTGHDARIWDIDMGVLNKRIYFMTCSEDSTCIVYEKGKPQNHFQFVNNDGSTVRCICFHAPLGVIISGSDNGTVHVRSLSGGVSNNGAATASSGGPPKGCTQKSAAQITNGDSACRGGHSQRDRTDDIHMAVSQRVNRTGDEIISNVNQLTCKKESNPCDQLPRDSGKQYTYAKDLVEQNDSIHFVVDYLEEKLKRSNDWIRSVSHVNLHDIIISTNAGRIYIFKTKDTNKIEVLLIYEEEKKNYLLTCLAFHGLNYICLGFSNGFCCFIFLKNENAPNEVINSGEQNKELTYFKCFDHRISEMCLVPLAGVNYDMLISPGGYDNVENVLHAWVKKEVEGGGASDGSCSRSRYNTDDPHATGSFYQIVYNHEVDSHQHRGAIPHNAQSESSVAPVRALLLAVFDHTGAVQMFSVQKAGHKGEVNKDEVNKGEVNEVARTDIDVKNKKSKIISVNYLMKQKRNKMGIIFLVGDEYGCIFIIYVKIPIEQNSGGLFYHFTNSLIKSKHKLRVHSNRKVFDIKIIDGFVYSSGQNGQIVKHQLYKDGSGVYTLYKLCLIKVGFYTSIYKLLPMSVGREGAPHGGEEVGQDEEADHAGNVKCKPHGHSLPRANATLQSCTAPTHSEEENTQNMFICCFKEKQFVLYDLRNKVEYLSVDCGGFRRPLSIFTKSSPGLMKAFSFCFCKEKNVHFSVKQLCSSQQRATVPYEQIYINAGFHSKNVSCVLWVNKRYLCTCSEDGTIKVVQVKKYCAAKWKRKCSLKGGANTNWGNNTGGKSKGALGTPPKEDKQDGRPSSRIIDGRDFSPGKKYYSPFTGASLKRTHTNAPPRKSPINLLNHRMDIIQNVYNHSEPIFYTCFLESPFHHFKKLKLLTSVGAKNSINIFYLFMDAQNVPIIYHVEKVRGKKFSSDLRFLSVQGRYRVLTTDGNKHLIRVDLFVGTSLGLILHYAGEYEFAHYENIIFSKVVQLAHLVCSYNLGSTILALNLTDVFLSDFSAYSGMHDGRDPLPSCLSQKRVSLGNAAARETIDGEEAENCEGATAPPSNNVEEEPQRVSRGPPNEQLFQSKRKGSKTFRGSILCCGLNSGEVHFYHFGKQLVPLLEKVQLHQNGINKICVKRKKDTLEVFTCGDDQSLNVLTVKICLSEEAVLNGEPNRIHLSVVQRSSFTNAHLSSIRSLALFSHFVASVSWDQYISIWSVTRDKNENVFLKREKKIKMAVYDVSCLNVYVIRKKPIPKRESPNGEPPPHCLPIGRVKKGSKRSSVPPGASRNRVYLTVAGSNGSLELFCLNVAA
ncbi:WD repeat-containing protein, putative [Plasmodium vivax]|uniref:WD repeat-containing protein, putative n=1 Tax=Plasmodium vivax TaxID=5855 RepID=A0A1G4HDV2_PLAVI|nr:WD repeat-containing protein, putative [Plasmodium vivax]